MKKILFVFTVAAVALTACTNESTEYVGSGPEAKEIAFKTLVQPMTRGAVENNAAFPVAYNFLISAFAVDAAKDYFNAAEYTREGSTGNTWSGVAGQKKYWPLGDETLNFLAVTKSTGTTTFGSGGANYASKVEVVLPDNKTIQHDLMYSYASAAVVKTGNTLAFNGGSNVALPFKHMQSWVYFTAIAADAATAGAGITVTNIKLKGAKYEGTVTVDLANYNSKTTALTPTLAWDATVYAGKSTADVDVPSVSSIAVTHYSAAASASDQTAQNLGDGLMVVPNPTKTNGTDLDASFSSFVITYTLNGNSYDFEYTPTDPELILEPGKKYNYNITFTLHEIKVDATVDNWTVVDRAVVVP